MATQENKLRKDDYYLFASLKGGYNTENERIFFETMRRKMESELAPSNELLMSELDNEERIYIVRVDYDEFIVGHKDGQDSKECHTMSLSEALKLKLNEIGAFGKETALFEWLRERDYKGLCYDRNFARM